jgi:hypothetical protein
MRTAPRRAVQRSWKVGAEVPAASLDMVPVELAPTVTDFVAVERVTTVVVEERPVPEAEPEPPEPLCPGVMVVQLTMVVQET